MIWLLVASAVFCAYVLGVLLVHRLDAWLETMRLLERRIEALEWKTRPRVVDFEAHRRRALVHAVKTTPSWPRGKGPTNGGDQN